MAAPARPLNMFPLEREITSTMAHRHREKYSQGPSIMAIRATYLHRTMAMTQLKKVPMKESMMPVIRSFFALPCLLNG